MNNTVLYNNMAIFCHRLFFSFTPYRTGNLARSVGDVGDMGGGKGFVMFDNNQKAPYGAILNEAKIIKYRVTNKYTGKTYEGEYVNKHFNWVQNGVENVIIPNVCTAFNLRRI